MDRDSSLPWLRIEKKGKRSKSFGDRAEIVYIVKNQENKTCVWGHHDEHLTILQFCQLYFKESKLKNEDQSNDR